MRILVIAGCVLFVLSVTIPFTSLAAHHPCASPTPPPVSGTPVQPSASAGKLFINEVLLAPHATWNCSELDGTSTPVNDTWVEIYNSQDVAYDLTGVNATLDSGSGTNPFYFPINSVIAPHSFLVLFPRTDANFLQSETSTLRLLISGSPVDSITVPALPADTSYARSPDGSDTWQLLTNPTIGASNPSLQTTPTTTVASNSVHTPAPTATPKHKATRTPTPHTSRKHSGTGQQDSEETETTQTADSGSTTLVDGNQPAWGKMSIGVVATASATSTPTETPLDEQMQATPVNENRETIRKVGMTLTIVALAGGLFWCGRIFIPLASRKRNSKR